MIQPAPPEGESIQAAMMNRQFDDTWDRVKKLIAEGDIETVVMTFTARPYRVDMFDQFVDDLSDRNYWRILGELWIDQENPEDFTTEWVQKFKADRPHGQMIMTPDERKAFAALPDEIKVYRADIGDSPWGPSWTTDAALAAWFSTRFNPGDPHPVYGGVVSKKDVRAYFTRRGENEILVLEPGLVKEVRRVQAGN